MSEQLQTKAVKWVAGVGFTVIFSLLSFITLESVQLGKDFVKLDQKVEDGKEARKTSAELNTQEHVYIQNMIMGLVSRREFESEIQRIKADIVKIQTDLVAMSIKLIQLESQQ